MTKEIAIEKLKQFIETKDLKKSEVERELGMPLNSLSNYLSLKKELPEKWVEPIANYISSPIQVPEINGHEKTQPKVEGITLSKKEVKNNDEKMKALRLTIERIDKDFGKGSVQFIGDTPQQDIQVISTGSIGLDAALGVGGLPKGRIIEIYGQEGSGKTTIALQVIREAQKKGETCAFIDAEHSFDNDYAISIGINIDDLMISQPDYGEQGLEIADRLIQTGAVGVIVIDSVAALVPKSELEGEMGDSKMGLHARLMSQACRKLTGTISKTNCVCIFINQMRAVIGAMPHAPQYITTGGKALKFYASVRLDVARIATLNDGDVAYGNRVRVKVAKNKVAPPYKTTEFDLIFGKGIDTIGEIIELATDKGVIKKAGSWYSYDDSKLGQGKEQVKFILNDNPEMLAEIKSKMKL